MLSDQVKAVLQQVAGRTIQVQTDDELLELLRTKADQALAAEVGIKPALVEGVPAWSSRLAWYVGTFCIGVDAIAGPQLLDCFGGQILHGRVRL